MEKKQENKSNASGGQQIRKQGETGGDGGL